MRAKLFKFVRESTEWKERGTGEVRLLKHKENGKTRLVMRRDKTLKVCANHYRKPFPPFSLSLSPSLPFRPRLFFSPRLTRRSRFFQLSPT